MNITRAIAEDIEKKMTQQMREHLKEKEKNLAEYITLIALNQTPVSVQKVYKEHPEFFYDCNTVNLVNGTAMLSYCDVIYGKVPQNNRNKNYKCDNEQFDFVSKTRKDIDKFKEEIKQMKESIISTLLSLRTIKKVIENFPDAAPYAKEYEKKNSTALALPINEISKVLNKYNK